MAQTILDDLTITIVNDCCPDVSYKKYVDMFKPYVDIKEIKLKKNSGPGVARQKGIDEASNVQIIQTIKCYLFLKSLLIIKFQDY